MPCDGEAEPLDVEVLAYLESQIPANPDSDGTTGEDDDPNLLYVRFSSETFTCADPHERLSCDHQWELSLRIPTAFQAPGLYTVKWTDILGFGMETGNDAPADDWTAAAALPRARSRSSPSTRTRSSAACAT
ncbi:hypothetical protein [Nannocystis pusilla]|uniref:hypothetical protein n=1 Tax=Nannocystis pusilla TaxID=889268 RepID=UPI003B80AB70